MEDKDFKRAQRAYDAQEHPDYYRKTCPNCRGDGEIYDDKKDEPLVCPCCKGDGEVDP